MGFIQRTTHFFDSNGEREARDGSREKSGAAARKRKGSLPEKRKSFSNILRWRRDDEPPPMPAPPPGFTLISGKRVEADDAQSTSSTASRSSRQSNRASLVGGMKPAYASSTLLRYASSQRAASTAHLGASGSQAYLPRPSMSVVNISSPLPGVGDVPSYMPPAKYSDSTPAEPIPFTDDASRAMPPPSGIAEKRTSRQRMYDRTSLLTLRNHRQSSQTLRPILREETSLLHDKEIAALLSSLRSPSESPRASRIQSKEASGSPTPRGSPNGIATVEDVDNERHDSTPPPLPEKQKSIVLQTGRQAKTATHVIEAPTPIVPRSELSLIGPSRSDYRTSVMDDLVPEENGHEEPAQYGPQYEAQPDPRPSEEPRPRRSQSGEAARPVSLLSTVSWGSASRKSSQTLQPAETTVRTSSLRAPSFVEADGDTLEDLEESNVTVSYDEVATLRPSPALRSSLSSAVSFIGTSHLTPRTAHHGLSSPSPSYMDLKDGPSLPALPSRSGLNRTPSTMREIQSLKIRNSTLEQHNARLEFEVMMAMNNPASSTTDLRSTCTDMRSSFYSGSNASQEQMVPALLAEIELLKRSGQQLQAELQVVKSLLLPPTPVELARREQESPDGYPFRPTHEIPAELPSPVEQRSHVERRSRAEQPSHVVEAAETEEQRSHAEQRSYDEPTSPAESYFSAEQRSGTQPLSVTRPLSIARPLPFDPPQSPAEPPSPASTATATVDDRGSPTPTPTDVSTPKLRATHESDADPANMSLDSCPSPSSSYSHSSRSSVAPLTPDTSHEWSPVVLPAGVEARDAIPHQKEMLTINEHDDLNIPLSARQSTTTWSGTPLTNLPPRNASKQQGVRMAAQVAAMPGVPRPTSMQQQQAARTATASTRPATILEVEQPQIPPTSQTLSPPAKAAPLMPASPPPPRPPRRSTLRRKVATGEVSLAELEEQRKVRARPSADNRTPSFTAF